MATGIRERNLPHRLLRSHISLAMGIRGIRELDSFRERALRSRWAFASGALAAERIAKAVKPLRKTEAVEPLRK